MKYNKFYFDFISSGYTSEIDEVMRSKFRFKKKKSKLRTEVKHLQETRGGSAMFLTIRMLLYWLFANVSGMGLGVFNEGTGTFSLTVTDATDVIIGVGGFVATFIASRFSTQR